MFSNIQYMLLNPQNAIAPVSFSFLAIGVQYAILLISKKMVIDFVEKADSELTNFLLALPLISLIYILPILPTVSGVYFLNFNKK